MRKRPCYRLLIPLALLIMCVQTVAASEDLDSAINYLLEYVKNSGLVFIRNNKEHTPDEAAAHMLRKYEHFRGQIKTPEDFIRLTGTKSLLSGKPYQVRTRNGKTILAQKWLEEALEEYRKEKME